MANTSKRKGYAFEVELVSDAEDVGLDALRAWGSDGRAIGESTGVDLVVARQRLQAKRRRVIPQWLQIPEGCDAVVTREDRGETLVLLPWAVYLQFLKGVQ